MPKSSGGGSAPLESYGATILRVALGIIFVMHAYLALFTYGIHGTIAFQRSLGLPVPEIGAWYVIVAHGLGGVMMILGVLTRWAALANLPIMAGAFFLVHLKQGFFMSKEGGYEFVFLVLAVNLALVFLGPGALALRK
ncbi:MAG TPA: DoxX family protein [Candidatus Limnocylindrales bacterium]|nr:DoxX family protein [Candidatus Limnocylindrales bacterium]